MSEWKRIEYGLIVDRRSKGLGTYLARTFASIDVAKMAAEGMDPEWPVEIKRRTVTYTDWQSLAEWWAGEHVGGCNDRCDGDSHYLLAQDVTP